MCRIVRPAVYLAGLLLVTAVSVTVALLVTPMQTVAVAGEQVRVGVAAPPLELSGPGELDLFGQQLPTRIHFAGPVRPRLALSRISLNRQLGALFSAPGAGDPRQAIGSALAAGWERYFGWEADAPPGPAAGRRHPTARTFISCRDSPRPFGPDYSALRSCAAGKPLTSVIRWPKSIVSR